MKQKSKREKLCWSRKLEVKLVEFIKEREYIWKSTDMNHKNIRLKYKAYAQFAEQLGGNFTARGVRDRWVNIRTTFTHNVKKVRETTGDSGAAGAAYVPGWHLWGACQFLRYRRGPTVQDEDSFLDEVPELDAIPEGESATGEGECERVVGDLLRALQPLQGAVAGTTGSGGTDPHCLYVGRHVTESLSRMRPFDAECATQKIMETLLLYSEFNPRNPNRNK